METQQIATTRRESALQHTQQGRAKVFALNVVAELEPGTRSEDSAISEC
jgi:hypothetical protein